MIKKKNYLCFRKMFLSVTFLLLASLPALAEVSKTVSLTEPGTLSSDISDSEKTTITNLTVYGKINSDDIATMKDMATTGALSVLNMSGAIADTTGLIGEYAFLGCEKLTSISFPQGVTNIGSYVFANCRNLSSITIPYSVTSIGNAAFSGCSSLASITIPNSVTSIGEQAFYGSRLSSVVIPNSVTSIANKTFGDCSSLVSIVIPNSVTSIGQLAFTHCSSLKSVVIPNSVTSIGAGAFVACSSLTSVVISNSVTSIAQAAFRSCKKLSSVVIPNSVTSIGVNAFSNCTSLTSVVISQSVTSLENMAFYGCTSLNEVTLQGETLPTCGTNAFREDMSDATLYCRGNLIDACRSTTPWSGFKEIVQMSTTATVTITDAGIATGCFYDDLDFTDVEGLKAYLVSGFNPETGKVLLTNVKEIPAGTGFIVKGAEGTYTIPAARTRYMYANLLVGALTETSLAATDGSVSNYVLGNEETTGIGFYLPSDGYVLAANKAYLRIPTSISEAKSVIGLSFDDEDDTTGFIPVSKLTEATNGNPAIYDLNGQRKQYLTKGLNIVNGKKILVR